MICQNVLLILPVNSKKTGKVLVLPKVIINQMGVKACLDGVYNDIKSKESSVIE